MRFFNAIFVIILTILLTSCTAQPQAPSPVVSPTPTTQSPLNSPFLFAPKSITLVKHESWGVYLSSEKLGMSVALNSDIVELDRLGFTPDKMAPTDSVAFYPELGVAFQINKNKDVIFAKADDTNFDWKVNGLIGLGQSLSDLTDLLGDCPLDLNGSLLYNFDKSFNPVIDATPPFASAQFHISNGVIDGVSIVSVLQETPAILASHGILEIYSCVPDTPNTASGVTLNIKFSNFSNKTIKCITFFATPYNAVDDSVRSEISGESTIGLKATGPYETTGKEQTIDCVFENVWYNKDIASVKIGSVTIEYTDGSIITLPVVAE